MEKYEHELAKENGGKTVQFSGQTKDELQGVADFLANVNLGYNFKWNDSQYLDFVISYSYIGKNLYAIGTNNTGNFYELNRSILDINFNLNLDAIGIGISGKNLLNPSYKINQINQSGTFVHQDYKRGRLISLNLSYKF